MIFNNKKAESTQRSRDVEKGLRSFSFLIKRGDLTTSYDNVG